MLLSRLPPLRLSLVWRWK
ncbi:hypothetical protein CFP56_022616 [Quercus suber]|uniref:Uncharacterized protein n=1 Tax=Quercus suber TaxID=58331 RepID=A0AAW0LYX0_QUESU